MYFIEVPHGVGKNHDWIVFKVRGSILDFKLLNWLLNAQKLNCRHILSCMAVTIKILILTEIYFYIVLNTHQWLDEDGDQNIVSVASHSAEVQGCCLWRYPW